VNIQSYIQSGIVEAYVLGLVTPVEKQEFEQLLPLHPDLREALNAFEGQVEKLAEDHAIPPPDETRQRFEDFLKGLPVKRRSYQEDAPPTNGNGHQKVNYITAHEVSSSHIKVHKYWRPAVLALFVVSKIILALLIYYMIKYYDASSQLQQLQHQVEIQKH
jgi:hypothetical protein